MFSELFLYSLSFQAAACSHFVLCFSSAGLFSPFLRIIYIETPHRAPVCHGLPLPSLQGDGVVGAAGSIESSGLDEVE